MEPERPQVTGSLLTHKHPVQLRGSQVCFWGSGDGCGNNCQSVPLYNRNVGGTANACPSSSQLSDSILTDGFELMGVEPRQADRSVCSTTKQRGHVWVAADEPNIDQID